MLKLPTLKRRKPIVYISLGIYVLLIAFIMFEASLSSGITGLQSMAFADIGSFFVNLIEGPKIPKEIAPLEFASVLDSSYLGQDDKGDSLIALGTTTLLSVNVQYPKKDNSYDVYKQTYDLDYVLGNKSDYDVVINSNANNTFLTINLRVVAKNISSDDYQININVADTLTYEYKFHIVELAEPSIDEYESKIDKTDLKIGETATINTKLIGSSRGDYYLRRYFDITKINRSSSNNNVATIDEFGVVHAHSSGDAKITFGKYSFNVHVNEQSIQKPVGNGLNLKISELSKDSLSLLDYDYVFEKDESPDAYSVLVYNDFIDDTLEDKNVSWSISDNLMAMVAPYKYDEEGYPVYKDDENRSCVRVCGYRKEGTLTLTCSSNADETLTKSIEINVVEAMPTEMNINVKSTVDLKVNDQIVVSATLSPKNVNNRNIHVEANNDAVTILNNDASSVIIKGAKIGSSHIVVTSKKNPELVKEFDITISAKQAINEDNYSSFHSAVRKFVGHFSLFLVTAVAGFIFFYTYFNDRKKWWIVLLITQVLGFAIAGFSELIQLYVPTRSGMWSDVFIDFSGYVAGSVLTMLTFFLIEYIVKKKQDNTKNS